MTPWFCGKERPILCSAPDVMAILDGRKTQTRRIMKPQPNRTWPDEVTPHWSVGGNRTLPGASNPLRCPYGVPGDRLWVRETWAPYNGADQPVGHIEDCDAVRYAADEVTHLVDGNRAQAKGLDMYAVPPHKQMPGGPWCWRPSIHMPRWASRITLEVTDVRVERLQGISEGGAMEEGVDPILVPPDGGGAPHVEGFRALWETINGPGAWAANPWVWAITFKRVTP